MWVFLKNGLSKNVPLEPWNAVLSTLPKKVPPKCWFFFLISSVNNEEKNFSKKEVFSFKTLHSTCNFQLWQLCRNFDTKFWMNFVPESKTDETSHYPSKEKHANPENVPQETSITVLEILSMFFTFEVHFANFRKHF